jgi:predicted ATPase
MEAITPDKLLAMLDEHLVFRNRFADAAPNRHETLLATIDWSFGLLSETEATIFCLTSVFSDTFELEDAVAIAAAHSLSPLEVIAGLGGLVGKSLIAAQVNGAGLRYRLLDSTRRYARNRMQAAGLEQKSQRAHAERVLRLFEQSESEWGWRDKQEWVHNYHSRLADLRVALRWAFGDEGDLDLGVRLTASTIPLWTEASLVDEARNRVELAMKEADRLGCDPLLRAKLALAWAWSMMYGRPYTPGIGEAWAAAHEHAEKAGALDHQLQALVGHSYFLMDTGHISQAIKRLEKFESLADLHHYRQLDPECISAKAWAKAHSGNMVESLTELETLTIAHSHNPQPTRKHGLLVDRNSGIRGHIPLFAWVTGRVDYAATVAEETLEAAERDGMLTSQSNVLAQALCPVSFYRGDLDSLHLNVLRLHSILEMDTIGVWLPVQRFYAAALDDLEGDHNADQRMKAAIDEFIDSRFFLRVPGCLCTLADIYVRKGKLEDATNAMDLAEKYESQHGERWCRSELMRIKARLLSSKGDVLRSEHLLLEARDEARFSNALSFELRIASDLANGFLDRGRYDDAKRILQPVYAKFDEGFTTRDMGIAFELIKRAEIYQQRS